MGFSEDELLAAGFLFERANGNQLGDFELEEIRRQDMNDVAPEMVAGQLREALEDEDCLYRSRIYWALGKRFDKSMIPLFRKWLSVELGRDMLAVYSLLIALDNLKEPVFSKSREGGYAFDEYELNRADGVRYLQDSGVER